MADELNLNTEREQFGKWLALAQAAFDNDATQTTPEPDMFGAWLAARRAAPSAEAIAPYSAPFTTDVPQCCGEPKTCNDPCEPASTQAEDLPPLPAWALMDNLGNIVPSDVRLEMRNYARAAIVADRASRAAEAQVEPANELRDAAIKWAQTRYQGDAAAALDLGVVIETWKEAHRAGDRSRRGIVAEALGLGKGVPFAWSYLIGLIESATKFCDEAAEAQGEGLTGAVKRAIFAIHDDQLISRDIIIHAITKAIAAHLRAAGQPKPIIESSDKPYITGGKCAFCGSVAGQGGDGELIAAAEAVVARWDSPLWKDQAPTAELIARLSRAAAKAKAEEQKG